MEGDARTVLHRDQEVDRESAWVGGEGDQRETTHGKEMEREFPGDYSSLGKIGAISGVIFNLSNSLKSHKPDRRKENTKTRCCCHPREKETEPT